MKREEKYVFPQRLGTPNCCPSLTKLNKCLNRFENTGSNTCEAKLSQNRFSRWTQWPSNTSMDFVYFSYPINSHVSALSLTQRNARPIIRNQVQQTCTWFVFTSDVRICLWRPSSAWYISVQRESLTAAATSLRPQRWSSCSVPVVGCIRLV